MNCFQYLESQAAAERGYLKDVVHTMNEVFKAWGELKSVLSRIGLWMNIKKCLYEGVIVQRALYGAEALGMKSAKRTKVNVLEMKYLRNLSYE